MLLFFLTLFSVYSFIHIFFLTQNNHTPNQFNSNGFSIQVLVAELFVVVTAIFVVVVFFVKVDR